MKITVKENNNVGVLLIDGDIDAQSCGNLKEKIIFLLNKGCGNILLDLNSVEYIDSSGFGELISLQNMLYEKKYTFKLINLSISAIRLFKILGIRSRFDIYNNEKEAIESI